LGNTKLKGIYDPDRVTGKKTTKATGTAESGRAAADPLGKYLSSTDIARLSEYEKLTTMLLQRMARGQGDTSIYVQALDKINKEYADLVGAASADQIDFGFGYGVDELNDYYEQLRLAKEEQDSYNQSIADMNQEMVDATEPTAALVRELERLDAIAKLPGINQDAIGTRMLQLQGQIDEALSGSKDAIKELDTFAENAAKNIQDSMVQFLINPFENGLKGMAQSFGKMLQQMIAETVAADLARRLFGGLADSGKTSGSGLIGGALTAFGNLLFPSANGNVFGGVQAFASGGILGPQGGMLTRPTLFPMANGGLGIGGEAGVEAVMPLKRGSDGKLGVASGGGGHTTINVTVQGGQSAPDVRRAAGQGAREALRLMDGARRYG